MVVRAAGGSLFNGSARYCGHWATQRYGNAGTALMRFVLALLAGELFGTVLHLSGLTDGQEVLGLLES